MDIVCLYPNAKPKAFTLSYDDGITQDRRLVELFNAHKVKATFNLNSGKLNFASGWTHPSGKEIHNLTAEEAVKLYAGHEIAVHTVSHPHLENLTPREITDEIRGDRLALESLFGQRIEGMAYPFGTWDDRVLGIMEREGIRFSRTVRHTYDFSTPDEFLTWDATCHHGYNGLMSLAKEFAGTDQELALFYVWGHSYEFDVDDNWNVMEELLGLVAGRDDVWYATNGQICDYLTAMREMKVQGGKLVNPTDTPLWVQVDGEIKILTKE